MYIYSTLENSWGHLIQHGTGRLDRNVSVRIVMLKERENDINLKNRRWLAMETGEKGEWPDRGKEVSREMGWQDQRYKHKGKHTENYKGFSVA